jgi:hypothetical protein
MNELILKRLAEESGFLNDVTKFEAFAVLLVKESAEFVNYYHSRNEPVTPQQILRHFGITE